MLESIVLLVISPFLGSFVGVLASRMAIDQSWRWTRSRCDTCSHTLSASDLIPFVSSILLRNRCRYCGATIGGFPLAIESAGLVIALWSVFAVPPPVLLPTAVFGWLLLALAAIDIVAFRLPNTLTLILGLSGLIAAYFYDRQHWLEHGGAALAGGAALLVVAVVYRWTRKREGLGYGDVKLFAAVGCWVSLSGLPSVLFLGAIFAIGGYLIGVVANRLEPNARLPFGPFLAMGAWLVWLYGPLVPTL